jgi:hypothetical protein
MLEQFGITNGCLSFYSPAPGVSVPGFIKCYPDLI